MPTYPFIDADGNRQTIHTPPVPGQAVAAESNPVVLASDQPAVPVSGTVTANAGTGTFAVQAGALPLPTGASTEATLLTLNTKTPTLGQKNSAGSIPVVIASDQSAVPVAPNITRGNGVVDANTQRVILATDSGVVTALASIDTKTPALVGGATPVSATALPLPTGASTETTLAAASAKLPASLGIKTAAASMSIAPASDAQFSSLADTLPRVIASTILTRRATTTAYAAGQLIGGAAAVGFTDNGLTFSNASRVAGGSVQINRVRLYKSQATALGTFEVRIYRAIPATFSIGDTGVAATGISIGNAASNSRLVARAVFDMTTAVLGSDGAELAVLPLTGSPALVSLPSGASDLFAVIVATAAYTPASGETFSVILEGYTF